MHSIVVDEIIIIEITTKNIQIEDSIVDFSNVFCFSFFVQRKKIA